MTGQSHLGFNTEALGPIHSEPIADCCSSFPPETCSPGVAIVSGLLAGLMSCESLSSFMLRRVHPALRSVASPDKPLVNPLVATAVLLVSALCCSKKRAIQPLNNLSSQLSVASLPFPDRSTNLLQGQSLPSPFSGKGRRTEREMGE